MDSFKRVYPPPTFYSREQITEKMIDVLNQAKIDHQISSEKVVEIPPESDNSTMHIWAARVNAKIVFAYDYGEEDIRIFFG